MTKYLVEDFDSLVSVDESIKLLDLIPVYSNNTKVHSLFEDYRPKNKFNTIILEHLHNPIELLLSSKEWLNENGMLIVGSQMHYRHIDWLQ